MNMTPSVDLGLPTSKRFPMLGTPMGWVLSLLLAALGAYLLAYHTTHVLLVLPYTLLLSCPPDALVRAWRSWPHPSGFGRIADRAPGGSGPSRRSAGRGQDLTRVQGRVSQRDLNRAFRTGSVPPCHGAGLQRLRRPAASEDPMSIRKAVIGAIVLTVAMPFGLASASDEEYAHRRDHAEHEYFHDRVDGAHEAPHELGLFESGRDHRRYHHRYDHAHDDFHDDHPRTFHNHRRFEHDD